MIGPYKHIVLPKSDTHFKPFVKKGKYQLALFGKGVEKTKRFGTAVDVGAHVGFWSCAMADKFDKVIAFEPVKDNYDCLVKNVPDNVKTYNYALGEKSKRIGLYNPAPDNSGAWEHKDGDEYSVHSLDSLEFVEKIDLIKIDVQGMEMAVLEGAKNKIKQSHPVIITEIPKGEAQRSDEVQFILFELGYDNVQIIGNKTAIGWW